MGESLRNVREIEPARARDHVVAPGAQEVRRGSRVRSPPPATTPRGAWRSRRPSPLDSTFAMAWRRLVRHVRRRSPGSAAQQQHAISQAFKFRDHLSEDERLLTEAGYYDWGPAPDRERAIAAYESLIERDSTSSGRAQQRRHPLHEQARLRTSRRSPPAGNPTSRIRSAGRSATCSTRSSSRRNGRRRTARWRDSRRPSPRTATSPLDDARLLIARGRYQTADSLLRKALPAVKSDDVRGCAASFLSRACSSSRAACARASAGTRKAWRTPPARPRALPIVSASRSTARGIRRTSSTMRMPHARSSSARSLGLR